MLGPLAVSGTDHPVLLGPAQRRLTALLAVRAGRVVTGDQIADVLGLGSAGAVRTAVSRLRRLVGDVVTAVPPGYVLAPDVLDARRFEALLSRAHRAEHLERVELLANALDLWRGAALVEFASEEWAWGEAARLDERRLAAIEDWIDALETSGRTAEAAAHAEALIADQPLRERPRALYMTALASEGRTAEALRAYRDYRHSLKELGTAPSAELARLERRILEGDDVVHRDRPSGPLRAVTTNVPAVDGLIGRDHDTARVVELVAAHRLVTIAGPGGVGKSRLALVVAHEVPADAPDGTWLVELAPLGGLADVVGAVAGVVPVRSMPATSVELLEQIGTRRMLLVLDNCEHLIEDVACLVTALLAGCPGVRLLTTSREALALDGEHVWSLAPLADEPAVALFEQRARAVRADLRPDPATVGVIVRRLDGLPLAIELAAARVATLSPGDIAGQLDDRFSVLSGGVRGRHPRHRGLAAMVDWGHGHCEPGERRLFRRLGVFAGSFTRDAAVEVADVERVGGRRVAADLDQLVRRSMVVADVDGGATRYRLLETLRLYAVDRLAEAGESEAIAARHAEWCTEMALGFAGVDTPDETRWLARGVAEFDNLRAAVAWIVDHRATDLGVRLVGRLLPLHRLWRIELLDWARRILRLPGAVDHPEAGPAFALVASLAWTTGGVEESERASDEALSRPLEDAVFILASRLKLAMLGYRGGFAEAKPVWVAAQQRATTPELRLALDAQRLASEAYTGRRKSTDHDRLLAETDALRRPGLRSLHRSYLALSLISRGETARATSLLHDALELAQPGLNRYAVNIALEALTLTVAGEAGSVSGGEDLTEEAARALTLTHDYPLALGFGLVGLMVKARRLGRHDAAALLAGYLTTHATELGLPTASAEVMAGAPLDRFVAVGSEPDYRRGRALSAAAMHAELERLGRR